MISELQDRIQGSQWFTALDIRGASNLVRMREGGKWKTAFQTRYKHYKYTVMSCELTNAPATFQALINTTLCKYLDIFITAYLNDILIYTKSTLKEHIQEVKKVFKALQEADIRLWPDKCKFQVKTVRFLGSIITTDGIQMDKKKVKANREWPEPRNLKEVQVFLGFANFYQRFIQGYSQICTPLTKMTKKEQSFHWECEQREAFEKLKKKIYIGTHFGIIWSWEKNIILKTDASNQALESCLSQPDAERQLHPVAYRSRKFSGPELSYDVHDKELLAIVDAFEELQAYLEGSKHPIVVYSDHKNLSYFTTTKKLNRQQVKWAELLASYNFQIHYWKGSENRRAGVLSRRSDLTTEETKKQSLFTGKGKTLVLNKSEVATLHQDNAPRWRHVPEKDQRKMISNHHNGPILGHPGCDKTIELIQQRYQFLNMRKAVENYIWQCTTCAQNKSTRHKLYGKQQQIKAPQQAWQEITIDFIVKLPLSKDTITDIKYNSILVVVDRLTKYAHFIPWKEKGNAEDLAKVILKEIIANHGIPQSIISDRDKLFTFKFWNTWTQQLGTKVKLLTAYHPQTDRQTEQTNQTLEQYLRHYINFKQNNWIDLLPLA